MASPIATRTKSLQTLLASRERPLCRLERLCVERLIRDFLGNCYRQLRTQSEAEG